MNSSIKKWEEFSSQEQDAKLKAIVELLQYGGLGKIKPKAVDQIIYYLIASKKKRQQILTIEGTIPSVKGEKAKMFKKLVQEGPLKDVKPETVTIEIKVKMGMGAPYQKITAVTDIYNEKPQEIKHKPGQVMLIDFWASWCPPCQKPMAHNQEMLEQHGARWGDKVRIVGISIDQAAPAVVKHVQSMKWEKVQHFHRAQSSCSKDYDVSGVPRVLLVDGEGKIAFAGHPSSIDIEKSIEKLVKGQKLDISGGQEEEEEEKDDWSGYSQLDLTKIREEMGKWETKV